MAITIYTTNRLFVAEDTLVGAGVADFRVVKLADHLRELAVMREALKRRLDIRMNNHLLEMKPDYDDSIVGFNQAQDIVDQLFKGIAEEEARAAKLRADSKTME
jgi:hypothetical protein